MIGLLLLLGAQALPAVAPAPEAQAAVPAANPPAPPAEPQRIVAAGTLIDFEFVDAASSKTSKSGERINLRTIEDVRGTRGELLIPRGSKVVAEVIQASPARMMGKAGELTLAARFVEVEGQQVPLKRFRFGPSSGKDNNGATWVATALIGLPGMLISGGNVDIAAGARANAVVTTETLLTGTPAAQTVQQGGQ